MSATDPAGTSPASLGGIRSFMGIEIEVAPGVLVPRPETELLGRAARQLLDQLATGEPGDRPFKVIDMCCGSGNLACALAVGSPRVRAWACDLTTPSVMLAGRNVRRLGLEARVSVHQGDLFAALSDKGLEGSIDLIVCNPPYISTQRLQRDRAALLQNEPREAFDGGPYGISVQARIVKDAPAFLKPGGWLLFEIGLGQDRQTARLLERAGQYANPDRVANREGAVRVMICRKL